MVLKTLDTPIPKEKRPPPLAEKHGVWLAKAVAAVVVVVMTVLCQSEDADLASAVAAVVLVLCHHDDVGLEDAGVHPGCDGLAQALVGDAGVEHLQCHAEDAGLAQALAGAAAAVEHWLCQGDAGMGCQAAALANVLCQPEAAGVLLVHPGCAGHAQELAAQPLEAAGLLLLHPGCEDAGVLLCHPGCAGLGQALVGGAGVEDLQCHAEDTGLAQAQALAGAAAVVKHLLCQSGAAASAKPLAAVVVLVVCHGLEPGHALVMHVVCHVGLASALVQHLLCHHEDAVPVQALAVVLLLCHGPDPAHPLVVMHVLCHPCLANPLCHPVVAGLAKALAVMNMLLCAVLDLVAHPPLVVRPLVAAS